MLIGSFKFQIGTYSSWLIQKEINGLDYQSFYKRKNVLSKFRKTQSKLKAQNRLDSNSYQIKQRHFPLKLKSTATFFLEIEFVFIWIDFKENKV